MISEKLMMAVLALDAYSRSTPELIEDVRLFEFGGEGSSLGGVTVIDVRNIPGSSFAAVTYAWNGKTIISFRGTDNPLEDLWSGWTLGAGFEHASQAQLAQQYYTDMTGKTPFEYAGDDVILTGHSLGGGLAGFLSALNGTKAYGFDHMTFGPAAAATMASHLADLGITDPTEAQLEALGLRVPSADNFIGTYVEGEILEGVRDGTTAMAGSVAMYASTLTPILGGLGIGAGFLLQAMSEAQAEYESGVRNGMLTTFGWSETWLPDQASELFSSFDRHSQGLLVLLHYAVDETTGGQWASSGFAVPLISALFDDDIALSAGIYQDDEPGQGISGKSNPADLMLTKIAYTVLDSGNRPFGDSAIRALFNDAESVGNFINNGGGLLFDAQAVADDIARYAALLAHNEVTGDFDGFVSHTSDMLSLDYTQETWTFEGHEHLLSGFQRDFSNYLDDGQLNLIERVNLDGGPGRIEYEYYSQAAGGWHGQIGFESDIYTVKAVCTDAQDGIVGTNGDEQIFLGAGNDTVKANGGVNWIDGGADLDTLIDDHAWADFQITLDDGRYYIALRDSGTDPRIHVVENVELFEFDGVLFGALQILNQAPTDISFTSLLNTGLPEGTFQAGSVVGFVDATDANAHDRFDWEVLGDAAQLFEIDGQGVIRAKTTIQFNYAEWRGQVGATTFAQWQAGEYSAGFAGLLDTQYGFQVQVTDASGEHFIEDVYLYLTAPGSLVGTAGNEVLQGGPGRTIIAGLGGADQIRDSDWSVLDYSASTAGVRILSNGVAYNAYGGHAEGDTLSLSGRVDAIGSQFDDEFVRLKEVWGGAGNDRFTGVQIVHAGEGYDYVTVTAQTNFIDFGTGGGELKLADYTDKYFVDMEAGIYQRVAGSNVLHSLTVLGDYSKITGSNYDDIIRGTAEADRIYGGGGPYDNIDGRAGDDYIEGQGSLYGGADDDVILLTGRGQAWGGAGKDKLTTSTGYTTLYGGTEDDVLTSLGSRVTMVGGEGADSFIGGSYSKINTISYQDAAAGIGIDYNGLTDTGNGWAGEATGDTFSGKFSFQGSSYADTFNLILLNNLLDSVVKAGAGDDTVVVEFVGRNSEVHGDGTDSVDGSDNDVITSTGSDFGKVYGGRGDDIITGVGWLYGGTGSDTIKTAVGDQNVYLGLDSDTDTFIYSGLSGRDRVHDFTAYDVLRFEAGPAFDTLSEVMAVAQQSGGDVKFQFANDKIVTLVGFSLASLTASNFEFM